jgi:hypothetical protein
MPSPQKKHRRVHRRNPNDANLDDLECRDRLHAGRPGYSYYFTALNVGLHAVAKMHSRLCSCFVSLELPLRSDSVVDRDRGHIGVLA